MGLVGKGGTNGDLIFLTVLNKWYILIRVQRSPKMFQIVGFSLLYNYGMRNISGKMNLY